ncbi:putative amidase [Hypoxylon argillaceum]|nr:putative amidase [Hypoxylon argillaceum]
MAAEYPVVHTIAETQFIVHPQVVGTLIEEVASLDITPILILRDDTLRSTQDELIDLLRDYKTKDDIYMDEFSLTLVVHHSSANVGTMASTELTRPPGCLTVYNAQTPYNESHLPPGPYFLRGSSIHQAWRLFQPLAVGTSDGLTKAIAVPSRLYHKAYPEKPFAGARTALKDIFSLEGVKTTIMSRSYTELFGPDTSSAEYVRKLLSLGAVIVGKTKMTQFASSDEPTDQWIDFHCPVNPRGDQYQSPSGSSSGAAAALAGYPWLDYIRAPATCNGLFSLRPSFGSTSMSGVVVNSNLFDVVGLFSRTLDNLYDLASKTMDFPDTPLKFPPRILYPLDFFPHSNDEHQRMVEEFIGALESLLGTKRVEFSIAERWSQCPPEAAQGKSLMEYLPKSAFWAMCRDYYKGFSEFRSKYEATHEKEPYVGPVFRTWFGVNVLAADSETLSNAIMIMPYGSAKPKYRDAPNENLYPHCQRCYLYLSSYLRSDLFVVGQMPYQSRVSGRLEYRPIASTETLIKNS